jgi:hypothetical protein
VTGSGASRVVIRSPLHVPRHHLLSVIELGQVAVVRATHQADVVDIRAASEPEGMPVVEFQIVTLGASSSFRVHEAALALVALVDRTPHGERDVPRRRSCRARLFPRSARLPESPGLEALPQLPDCLSHDRREVAVRHLVSQEGPKSLEVVVQLLARRELDLVSRRRERLDDRNCCGKGTKSRIRNKDSRGTGNWFRDQFER